MPSIYLFRTARSLHQEGHFAFVYIQLIFSAILALSTSDESCFEFLRE